MAQRRKRNILTEPFVTFLLSISVAAICVICLSSDYLLARVFCVKDLASSYELPICGVLLLVCFSLFKVNSLALVLSPIGSRKFWLAFLVLICLINCLCNATFSLSGYSSFVLGGVLLAKWTNTCVYLQAKHRHFNFCVCVGFVSIITILIAGVWCRFPLGLIFQYGDNIRWSGMWGDPNIFGALMAVGCVLILGALILTNMDINEDRNFCGRPAGAINRLFETHFFFKTALLAFAGGCLFVGLLKSYSRGAWLGVVCGTVYLIRLCVITFILKENHKSFQILSALAQCSIHSCEPWKWFRRNSLPLVVIILSFGIFSWKYLIASKWDLMHRALSVANANDFSWRNRVVAWQADLQVIAENCWFGTSWSHADLICEDYYTPSKLNESINFQINDYFVLGTTLGVPALFCFGMYLWLSLKENSHSGISNPEQRKVNWLQATCRAGAIVLLVDFWFDGGLFKLAMASTFWALLELGNV